MAMGGIFISYRQEDAKPWALLLCERLAGAFGKERIFLDVDTLHAGNWRAQIDHALNQCRVVLVIIGRRWLSITDESGLQRLNRSDDVHRNEIALALSRKEITVIPVRVDGTAMPRAQDLPSDIQSLTDQQSRELSDSGARREVDMELLIEDIQRITGLKARRKELTPSLGYYLGAGLERGARVLKDSSSTVMAIFALSLAVWMFFYVIPPGEPLTPAETSVVLGACVLIVVVSKRLWARFRKDEKTR
jgi:hypothetical protein